MYYINKNYKEYLYKCLKFKTDQFFLNKDGELQEEKNLYINSLIKKYNINPILIESDDSITDHWVIFAYDKHRLCSYNYSVHKTIAGQHYIEYNITKEEYNKLCSFNLETELNYRNHYKLSGAIKDILEPSADIRENLIELKEYYPSLTKDIDKCIGSIKPLKLTKGNEALLKIKSIYKK